MMRQFLPRRGWRYRGRPAPVRTVVAAGLISGFAALIPACMSDHAPAGPSDPVFDCPVPAEAVRRGDRLVFIRDFALLPAQVEVNAGETVTWVNCEPPTAEPHTTTADAQEWGSPLLHRAESYSHTFHQRGLFGYYCLPHNAMRGSVSVR
jgi:plastocyanin